jgi:hypothetical protein
VLLALFATSGSGVSKVLLASRAPDHEPNDFAVADFNHDGNPDVAVVNTQTPFIGVFLGDGHGGFRQASGSPVRTESHPHGVVAEDFSGRGAIDLMTDSWGHDQIEMLVCDGRGGFTPGDFFRVGKRPYQRLRSADLNGDGNPISSLPIWMAIR